MVEQWNSDGGKMWGDSGRVLVEECGGTVEQCWWNSVVDQWNSVGETVEQ